MIKISPKEDFGGSIKTDCLKKHWLFHEFVSTYGEYCPVFIFNSMEKLWFAFVMKEEYNKTWDGEKWQKI
jgi:hypothetical protein